MGAVVVNETLEGRWNFLGEVGFFRVVGADIAVHFLRGEGEVKIVGNDGGFIISMVKIGNTKPYRGVYTPSKKHPPGGVRGGWGEGGGVVGWNDDAGAGIIFCACCGGRCW